MRTDAPFCPKVTTVPPTVANTTNASAPCARPVDWCASNAIYVDTVDCDGDGVPDPYCASGSVTGPGKESTTGFIGSASNCTDTWGEDESVSTCGNPVHCVRPDGWCTGGNDTFTH